MLKKEKYPVVYKLPYMKSTVNAMSSRAGRVPGLQVWVWVQVLVTLVTTSMSLSNWLLQKYE